MLSSEQESVFYFIYEPGLSGPYWLSCSHFVTSRQFRDGLATEDDRRVSGKGWS